jgi:hypothetical protein
MALNRRLCFTAQEPWVMVAYEMIFLIFILLSKKIWRHSLSLQVFCQIESALKKRQADAPNLQVASLAGLAYLTLRRIEHNSADGRF